MLKLQKSEGGQESVWFWCEPCDTHHSFVTKSAKPGGTQWDWNGDLERPTFSPSLLVWRDDPEIRCHLYLRNGQVEYLSDCKHAFAGRTVPVQPPAW